MATASQSADTPPPRRFRLTGPSLALDPRLAAVRRDLADIRLADRVFAPHYALAQACGVIAAAPLCADTREGTMPISEVLPGERFDVLEHGRERAWGIAADGTVGYVSFDALGPVAAPTHAVAARVAEPRGGGTTLPMGARVSGLVAGGSLESDGGAYDIVDLRPLDRPARDAVAVAEALIGAPHKPGGRSGAGLHCSGLVYLALTEAGLSCHRFLDGQARMGEPVAEGAPLERGDLLVFEDHVALVADADTVIHAAPAGVIREPLATVIDGGVWGPVTARRRP